MPSCPSSSMTRPRMTKQDPRFFSTPLTPIGHTINNLYTIATMMKQAAFFLALAASSASAIELTPENYAAETDGKSVFLKFFAPWVSKFYSSAKQHWHGLVWIYIFIICNIGLTKQLINDLLSL